MCAFSQINVYEDALKRKLSQYFKLPPPLIYISLGTPLIVTQQTIRFCTLYASQHTCLQNNIEKIRKNYIYELVNCKGSNFVFGS